MEAALRRHLPGGTFSGVSACRSRQMAAVRGRGNLTTESRMRFALVRSGVTGWKLHRRDLPGTPDFFFPKERLVVFVDGCFWHGCPRCGHFPTQRAAFWTAKIRRNRQRDRDVSRMLRLRGLRVIRFWEHDLARKPVRCVAGIKSVLDSLPASRSRPVAR